MSRRRNGAGKSALGPSLLALAQADMAAPTSAPSARVDAMLAAAGLTTGDPWNAAAVSLWVAEAAKANGWSEPPISGGDAASIVAQLEASGRWIPKASLVLADIKPGMVCAAYRNDVLCLGVVDYTSPETSVTYTIEGQAGSGTLFVAHRTRPLWLATFVGVGTV